MKNLVYAVDWNIYNRLFYQTVKSRCIYYLINTNIIFQRNLRS